MDISAEVDKNNPASSFKHFMLPVGLHPKTKTPWTPLQAALEAEAFVNMHLLDAKHMLDASKRTGITSAQQKQFKHKAMMHLAQAFHTIMDSTSPAHTDSNGWPVAYVGANVFDHSPSESTGKENAVAFAKDEKIVMKTTQMLRTAMDTAQSGGHFSFGF